MSENGRVEAAWFEAGKTALGSAILSPPKGLDQFLGEARDEWFPEMLQPLLRALRKAAVSGAKVTTKALRQSLGGDTANLVDAVTDMGTAGGWDQPLADVAKFYAQLRAISVCFRANRIAKDPLTPIEDVVDMLRAGATEIAADGRTELVPTTSVRPVDVGELGGTPTPWPDFDELLGLSRGWPAGGLSLIMCAEGVGKSVLLLQAALKAATDGGSVVFGTFEMSGAEMYNRMLRMHTGYANRSATPDLFEAEEFDRKMKHFEALDLSWYDATEDRQMAYPVETFCESVRRHARRHGRPDLICVDYIQRLRLRKPSRQSWLDQYDVALQLECLAGDMRAPLLAASQISEQDGQVSAKGGRGPQELASVVILGRWTKEHERLYQLRKNRHGVGKRCDLPLEFDATRKAYTWGAA